MPSGVGLVEVRAIFFVAIIPSAGDVLREADRARTLETKVRVWSRSLDPIDSIGQLLSITVGRNTLAEGILYQITEQAWREDRRRAL